LDRRVWHSCFWKNYKIIYLDSGSIWSIFLGTFVVDLFLVLSRLSICKKGVQNITLEGIGVGLEKGGYFESRKLNKRPGFVACGKNAPPAPRFNVGTMVQTHFRTTCRVWRKEVWPKGGFLEDYCIRHPKMPTTRSFGFLPHSLM